jgi:hypothetical protein
LGRHIKPRDLEPRLRASDLGVRCLDRTGIVVEQWHRKRNTHSWQQSLLSTDRIVSVRAKLNGWHADNTPPLEYERLLRRCDGRTRSGNRGRSSQG